MKLYDSSKIIGLCMIASQRPKVIIWSTNKNQRVQKNPVGITIAKAEVK